MPLDAAPLYSLISFSGKTGSVSREDASTDSVESYSLDGQENMITGTLWKTLPDRAPASTLLLVYTGFAEVLQEVVVNLAFIWLLKNPHQAMSFIQQAYPEFLCLPCCL